MKTVFISYRWLIAYMVVCSIVLTGVAFAEDGGLGAATSVPTVTATTVTATETTTAPPPTVTIGPTPMPTQSQLPSITHSAVPTAPAPTLTSGPPPTTPVPTVAPTPHNKAHGIKDACLVQRHWLLRQPCKVAQRLLGLLRG